MLVCIKCKRELRCLRNGVGIDFGGGHIYASDVYICPVCKTLTAKANDSAHRDPDHKFHDLFVPMTQPSDIPEEKIFNVEDFV